MQVVTDFLKFRDQQHVDTLVGSLSLKKRILIVAQNPMSRRLWEMAATTLRIPVAMDFVFGTDRAHQLLKLKKQEGITYDFILLDVNSKNENSCIEIWQKFSSPKVGFIFMTNKQIERHKMNTSWIFGLPLIVNRPYSKIDCLEILSLLLKNDLFEQGEL